MKKQNQCIHCFKTFASTSSLCRHNRNIPCAAFLCSTLFINSPTTSYSCTLTASKTSYTTLPALPNPSTSFASSPIPTTSFHSYALPATSIPTTSFHSYAFLASPIPTTSFHSDALPASPIHMTTANSNTVSFIRQPSSPLLSQSSISLTFFPVTPTRPRPQDNASLYSEHFTGSPRVLRITCPIEDCGNAYTRYSALQKHIECHHHINIEHKDKLFSSINDFYSWKTEMEQNSITSYVKDTAAYITKDNCCTIQYYNRHRSHSHQTKETCLRGSKKIGHACPSRIMCMVYNDGHVEVDYWKTHVGHGN
ncbi:uncharacterized protein LOC113376014 [Ctenocephalides felis]|uniref:uncharacterized protein LOC113376014 n=2 Tax=Ctenocephalides felis TaxID=7515 RepID=UPI000E6E1CD4|nr:uncharacterized protein LOC113376014 [Ctenocephalides felis]